MTWNDMEVVLGPLFFFCTSLLFHLPSRWLMQPVGPVAAIEANKSAGCLGGGLADSN